MKTLKKHKIAEYCVYLQQTPTGLYYVRVTRAGNEQFRTEFLTLSTARKVFFDKCDDIEFYLC